MAKKASSDMSKVDMVRDAIEILGWDVPVADFQKHIKDNFKVDMSKEHISQTKSNERKRLGMKKRRKRRKGGKQAVASAPAAAAASVPDILAFVDALKHWENKIGAGTVRDVVKSVLKK